MCASTLPRSAVFGGQRSGTDKQLHDIGMAGAGGDP